MEGSMKKNKWFISGYYLDGKNIWTILEDDHGKTKKVKGLK